MERRRKKRWDWAPAAELGLAGALAWLLEAQLREGSFWYGVSFLALCGSVWIGIHRSARGKFLRAGILLGLAGLLTLVGAWVDRQAREIREAEALAIRSRETLGGLMARARTVAEQAQWLRSRKTSGWENQRAMSQPRLLPGETVTFVAPDGEFAATFGDGFLHELREGTIPSRGYRVYRSAASVTVLAVVPVPGDSGWRVALGRSWRFRDPPPGALADVRFPPGSWRLRPGVDPDELPRVELLIPPAPDFRPSDKALAWYRSAVGVGGVGLGAWAGRRVLASRVLWGTAWQARAPIWLAGGLQGLALWLLARAAGAESWTAQAVLIAAPLAWWSWYSGRRQASGILVLAGGLILSFWSGTRAGDLAVWTRQEVAELFFTASAVTLLALAGGWLTGWTPKLHGWSRVSLKLGTAGAILLGLAVAPDFLWLSLFALCLGAVGYLALSGAPRRQSGSQLALVGILALALNAVAWFGGTDRRASSEASRVAQQLLPPPPELLERLGEQFEQRLKAAWENLPDPEELDEVEDLAFVLWEQAGFDRRDLLSAIVLEMPDLQVHFSMGLPLGARRELDPSPLRWDLLPQSPHRDLLVGREIKGSTRNGTPARIRFWILPRPGCCEPSVQTSWELESLLPEDLQRPARVLPPGSLWRLQRIRDRESPKAQEGVRDRRWHGGMIEALSRRGISAEALREPWHSEVDWPVLSFAERAELVVVGLTGVGALGAIWFLWSWWAGLPPGGMRLAFGRVARSYSKRLLVLVIVLTIVSVAWLYGFLRAALTHRLEGEQKAAASAALTAVQRILGEYMVSLEPGYGIPTALDDAMLSWLARAVGHDIHLFWRNRLVASSKPELFTSGLLGRQLPGEVQWELRKRPFEPIERRTAVGRLPYREVFLAMRLPGVPVEEVPGLVLAMPLRGLEAIRTQEVRRIELQAVAVAAGALLLLLALGSGMARRFARPIEELVRATRRVGSGAESLGFHPKETELETVALAIDQMATRLAAGRRQLLVEKEWVEKILETVASAVVVLDGAASIRFANTRAREQFGLDTGDQLEAFLTLHPQLRPLFPPELCDPAGPASGRRTLELPEADRSRMWSCAWNRVLQSGESRTVLVLDEVTEVLRTQRLEAWAAMARIVAHEVKNPLTPIRLAAQLLRETRQRDPAQFELILERSLEHILRQVDELQRIVSDFSTFAELPRCERKHESLKQVVEEAVAPYRDSAPPGLVVDLELPEEDLVARVDRRLLIRALANLLENAMRACGGRGKLEVRLERVSCFAEIAVRDSGPGAREEDLPRLLEPYFSTHVGGTGLGLPIALRIAQEHGGGLVVRNRAGGGFEAVVTIPIL